MYKVNYSSNEKSYYANLIEGYTGIKDNSLVALALKSLRLLCHFLELSREHEVNCKK